MKIDSENIILLHPGKTGGTSIEHTLRDMYIPKVTLDSKKANRNIMFGLDKEYQCYLQHADLNLYRMLNINYRNYKTITTIRRPYERILSCYFYNGKSKKFTFEEFVTNHLESCLYASLRKEYAVSHFAPQFFYTNIDDYSVKHIIKLENFKEDCMNAGLDVKYHYSQTTGTKKYNNYLDAYIQKTKDIVYDLYKEDFKLYGYKK